MHVKIAVESLPRQKVQPLRLTVDQFAKLHGLTMKIDGDSSTGYIAAFERVEVMDNGFLVSSWGRGKTINEAIKSYADQISKKRIAVNAYKTNRKEIDVPVLTMK